MFDREAFCQRYFIRKEAGIIARKITPAGAAGVSGEGRHVDLSSLNNNNTLPKTNTTAAKGLTVSES